MKLRYLSLFSGIEAASVAWTSLGWECVGVSEIEPFPCAVLKHHYPGTPNLGNVSDITKEQIEALGHIDIVIAGWPCQDLSVAGVRKGLKNADGTLTRSGLFYTAVTIAGWAKARWTIGENVPGLFSSNEGRDFAAVVGELAGISLDVPGDGWRTAGVALGERGLVEWATLDAQYCRVDTHPRAVPQRRRRVFIVRDTGDWASRPPLFLVPESMRGNPPPSRTAGEGSAGTLSDRTKGGGGLGTDFECGGGVIPIQEIGKRQSGNSMNGVGHGEEGDPMFTLQSSAQHGIAVTHTLRGEGFDASESCSPTLRAGKHNKSHANAGVMPAVAFQPRIARNGRGNTGDVVNALQAQSGQTGKGDAAPCVAVFQQSSMEGRGTIGYDDSGVAKPAKTQQDGQMIQNGTEVRRLTPEECEALQAMPREYTKIPWRGKPAAQCPDGPRYAALGNSMATNCMRWIGQRLEQILR